MRLTLVQQVVTADAQVLEQPIGDIGVAQLILNDRHRADHRVGGWSVLGGVEVRRRAHQLGVALHRELRDQRILVSLRHLVFGLDDEAALYLLLELFVAETCHRDSPVPRAGARMHLCFRGLV